ncbi:Signal peptidase complex subunit 2 [Niveomyces insectorum RCEF 264]|uniref:Signal peptidase complex subunit 2 n=1 Tax=Niveomyces insectorum RCEF 264 TaxID=1081102 RepID=A0A167TV15_9HYPO|nr:Signal peptidase complex subunit 2 [Niveomyces insectorum RCEF 264]
MSQEEVSVYNLADLKNTSDDAIPNYLNSLHFVQSHRLADVRLALGYSALALAGACFLWDWKLGFDATKVYSAAAVAVYLVLNAALTAWARYVEGATVYVGTAPDGQTTVSIATTTKKYVPVYNVAVTVTAPAPAGTTTIHVARAFADWFDSAGHFVAAPFQTILASAVPVIGQADPKRVVVAPPATQAPSPPSASSGEEAGYSAAMLDALAAATTTGSSSGSQKKGGKRRKA